MYVRDKNNYQERKMINNFISSRVGIDLIEIKNIFNFVTLVQWFFPSFFFHGKNLKVNEDKVSIIFLLLLVEIPFLNTLLLLLNI